MRIIQSAVGLDDLLNQRFNLGRLRDIGSHKKSISTGLFDYPYGLLTALDKDVGNDSFRPFSGKRQCACPAYSRSGARHQSHFAFELLGHSPLPGKVRLTTCRSAARARRAGRPKREAATEDGRRVGQAGSARVRCNGWLGGDTVLPLVERGPPTTRRRPTSYSARVRRCPYRASQAPLARSRATAAATRATTIAGIRAKPEVPPRASGSATRSGWAQNEPSIQSQVSCGIGTTSIRAGPPSQAVSISGNGKIRWSMAATSGR